jgi:Carboxypeptidase regulatory-like domain/TonB-dependent Receptor Plug Domain
MRKGFTTLCSALLLALCMALVVSAQETTGGIQGSVKDPQGAVIAGATITITGVTVGYNRTVNVDSSGFYRIQEMPPGEYRITVTATGFQMAPTTARVAVGKVSDLDLQMGLASSVSTVEVTSAEGQIVLDTTDNTVQSNISSKLIDAVPKGVSFDSLLRLDPATRSEPLYGGQFQVDGASSAENNFMINGQEVNNFRHGTLNGANSVPTSVVSEIQIKTSGFEAEFGGASGGVVSVVTKAGSNKWNGEFGLQFTTASLNAGNRSSYYEYRGTGANANVPYLYNYRNPDDSYTNSFPTANLSGPIKKDRVWFFASYSPQIFRSERQVNFFVPTTVNTNQLVLTPSAPTAANPQLVPQDTYRFSTRYEYALTRIDAQITNTLRFSGSFLWNPEIIKGAAPCGNICIGGGEPRVFSNGQAFVGTAYTNLRGGRVNSNNTTTQLVWTPSSKFFVNFRYGHNFLNDKPNSYGIGNQQRITCSSSGNPQNYAGSGCTKGLTTLPANADAFLTAINSSKRNTWNIDASYLTSGLGRHQFKAGYEHGGVYSDIDEGYRYGLTTLYYGIPITSICGPCAAATPGNFGSGTNIAYASKAQGSNKWDTLYLQDNWSPFKRLTLNLGVRTEKENLPAFNIGSSAANSAGTPITFGFGDKIMPRLGFALDLMGDGKTKVFGSFGWFMDRLRFELPIGSFGGSYYRYDYFEMLGADQSYTSFNQTRIVGSFSQPTGGQCPTLSTVGTLVRCELDYRIPSNLTAAAYTALGLPQGGVDPNLKPFRQSEITVGVERQVRRDMVFRFRYTHKNVDDAIEDMSNLSNDFGESYIIGNPGKGFALQLRNQVGYIRQNEATAIRRYDGAEFVLDKGLSHNYFFNVNYTYSRLFGNYSGLASSDEKGRSDPGVERFFDYPINGFTLAGTPDAGRLPTDRPHQVKAYAGYIFDWFGSKNNSTVASFFTQALSGTPLTTFVDVESSFIPLTKRGDLGRTERFTQTDLNFSHRYKFGRDKAYTMAFDVNVLNLFNESNVVDVQNTIDAANHGLFCSDINPAFTATQCMNSILSGGGLAPYMAKLSTPLNTTATYKVPDAFQAGRSIRFGFRFLF